jgi:alpha-glucosidase (family GH31 glycosyl hydrolase)
LHFIASKEGGTVVRPVFFEFPNDKRAFDLSYQFMWGSAIMVIPVTSPDLLDMVVVDENEDETTVNGYLPEVSEWYYLYSTKYGSQASTGDSVFDAPENSSAPVFLRGGSIVPRQAPALTTADTRKNHFQLVIACGKLKIWMFCVNLIFRQKLFGHR